MHWLFSSVFIATVVGLLSIGSFWFQVAPLFSDTEMAAQIQQYRALNKTCLVLGGTGETGKALLKQLAELKPFARVILIGRRKMDLDSEMSSFEQRIIDFDHLESHQQDFQGADVVYCCLGTTRGKSGADGFVKVDHDYVVGSAKLALNAGAKHFNLVSSTGADEKSSFLYPKVKGQVERELFEMGFERTSIYRPAMIMVDRAESRPMEAIARTVLKPVACLFPTLATTPVEVLARAMLINTAQEGLKGAEILDNKKIHELGKTTEQK